jgi:EmrB/QacA subfamily drug resistance transporter
VATSNQRAPEPLDRALKLTATAVVLGTIMSILDTTIVVVALHDLQHAFGASLATIQWVTTGYLLALALVIPLSGWAVDRFGARRSWLFALTMFIVGSALCGLAWSAESLIIFRLIQGLGGGMIMPIGQTIVARAAGPARMGRVMGVIGVPSVLGPVLGPVLGGLIVTYATWQLIFWVNVPIGIVAILFALRALPTGEENHAHTLDTVGLALISPGLAALVYGLSEVGINGQTFTTPKVLIVLISGTVLLISFCLWAFRATSPLLDLRLFRHRTFSIASVCIFLMGAALYGGLFLMPLYYQIARGQSALVAGLLMCPQGLGAMAVMRWSGSMSDRRGARAVVPLGSAIIVVGTLPFTMLTDHTPYILLALAMVVRGIGMGMSMMPLTAASYRGLDHSAIPRATTTTSILRQIGGSIATAVLAVLLQQQFDRAGDSAAPAWTATVAHGFAATFWWAIGASVLAVIPTLLLPSHTERGSTFDQNPLESALELAAEEPPS